MKPLLLICALASACSVEPEEPVYEYTCRLHFNCYDSDSVRLFHHATDYPFVGTIPEVKEFSHDWGQGCALLAIDYIESNKCAITACYSKCTPKETSVRDE